MHLSLSWVVVAVGVVLIARRTAECKSVTRTVRTLRARRADLSAKSSVDFPNLVVLVPLLREQAVAAGLLDHFAKLRYPENRLRIVFITTAREDADDGETTTMLLKKLMRHRPRHFRHLHFTSPHRYRADQLNYALDEVANDFASGDTFIAVYNADSRPDVDTFEVLGADAASYRELAGHYPSAYQQPARYCASPRHQTWFSIMRAHAAFQTVWTLAYFLPRLYTAERRRVGAGDTAISRIPVTFLGHGEFIRFDVLQSVGRFPKYAYGDGLLLGWMVAFHGHAIRVLPTFDNCEVPPTPKALIQQHAAWFVALSNLNRAIEEVFCERLRRSVRSDVAKFALSRHISTAAWGLRAPFAILWVVASLAAGRALFATAMATLLLVSAIPEGYLVIRHPSLSPDAASRDKWSLSDILARIAAALPAYLIDGVGFWLMLWLRLTQSHAPLAPAKTER